MDKDTLTGLLLIGLLFMTYTFMVTPPEEALKNNGIDSTQVQVNRPLPTDEENNSPTTATTNTTTTVLDGIFKQSSKQEVFKTIENDLLKVTVSNKGARPYKIELKNYVTYDSLALVLLDGQQNQLDYILPINRNNIHSNLPPGNQ